MARLEEIVARLGEGTATLDETLKLFQEGTELAAFCDKKLTDAKLKSRAAVRAETTGEGGKMTRFEETKADYKRLVEGCRRPLCPVQTASSTASWTLCSTACWRVGSGFGLYWCWSFAASAAESLRQRSPLLRHWR